MNLYYLNSEKDPVKKHSTLAYETKLIGNPTERPLKNDDAEYIVRNGKVVLEHYEDGFWITIPEGQEPINLSGINLEIGNGGVTFQINNTKFGAEIEIQSRFLGNITNNLKILTDKKSLAYLAKLFQAASERDYKNEYVHAAKIREEEEYVPRWSIIQK